MNWKMNLKDKFRNREIQPTPALWDALEKQLDKTQNKPIKHKILYYITGITAAAVVVFGVFLLVPFSEENSYENKLVITEIPFEREETIPIKDTLSVTMHIKANEPENKEIIAKKIIENHRAYKEETDYEKYLDELLKDDLDQIWTELETVIKSEYQIDSLYVAMGLNNLSAQELLQMASTEARLEAYLERQYNAEKMLIEIEKEVFKERIQHILKKIVNEYDKIRLALNEAQKQ